MTEIKRAIVKSYDAASHKAAVQIAGSLAVWLDDVRVATDIPAADVVAGRQCTVLFLDPSNQDDAVVITIQGANPSVPSGATVAASGTVVTETAFGQAATAGAASPYSRGDHTHGTPTDPVPAHAAAADPHTVYGALAQAETWAALQTFSAGIQLAAAQAIKDSGGTDRYTPATGSPHSTIAGDAVIAGNASIGPGATIDTTKKLKVSTNETFSSGVRSLLHIDPTLSFGGLLGSFNALECSGLFTLPAGAVLAAVRGLNFNPSINGPGAAFQFSAVYAQLTFAGSPVFAAMRGVHVARGAYTVGAGSGPARGIDVDDIGHANFPTATGLHISNQTGSATARLIEALGLTNTNLRVEAGDPTNPGVDKGRSQVLATFNENGVLALRRHEWKDYSTLAAGDRVMVAV